MAELCGKAKERMKSTFKTVFGKGKGLTKNPLAIKTPEEFGALASQALKEGLIESAENRSVAQIRGEDHEFINRLILWTWPFFTIYLFSQPWLSNYTNNMWFNYTAEYTVYDRNGSVGGVYGRPGICDTPAKYMHCTDGQNFTFLAMKYRNAPIGCGCGQGVMGEGLCPMTSYGYTLSDYVSTEPAIAAMLGLGFFPLLGTWKNTRYVNMLCKPSKVMTRWHMMSMAGFQISYTLWGIVSDCIFPTFHSVLTVVFLGSFLAHWVITAFICIVYEGAGNAESLVTFYVAGASIATITCGAVPRIFLTLNDVLGVTWFPNWNQGIGSYAFWLAEAGGLSLTFGAYPILLIVAYFFPDLADMDNSGGIDRREAQLFSLGHLSEHYDTTHNEDFLAEKALSGICSTITSKMPQSLFGGLSV